MFFGILAQLTTLRKNEYGSLLQIISLLTGRYELKLTLLSMCGFIAQLAEHCTRIHRGYGFESRWSPDFFRLLLSNCLNWKIYCNDHSSLSSTATVQIWIVLYILLISVCKACYLCLVEMLILAFTTVETARYNLSILSHFHGKKIHINFPAWV